MGTSRFHDVRQAFTVADGLYGMWLLNTHPTSPEPELTQFADQDLEDPLLKNEYGYAILSHRWEKAEEEISFPEMLSGKPSHQKKGWFKIDQSRRQAHREGVNFLWVEYVVGTFS